MGTKEELLKLFEEKKETYTSGEEIANKLGISRNAVWKATKQLKKEGYLIESKSNQGYRISQENNKLSAQIIKTYLKTESFGKTIEIYETLDSTNEKAKELAAQGKKSSILIIANSQSAGKGRRGRSFYSPKDQGIYMSLIIAPKTQNTNLIKLTTMSALGTCQAIQELTGLDPKIKWVNDIYLNGKKIAGILTEASTNLEDNTIDAAILGIGINISTTDFPEDIKNIATSLEKNINRNQLIAMIVNKIEKLWNQETKIPHIEEYKKKLILLNKQVNVIESQGSYEATVIDVDSEGALIVKLADNRLKKLNSGEISIKGNYQE